jgi:hypothetical protein
VDPSRSSPGQPSLPDLIEATVPASPGTLSVVGGGARRSRAPTERPLRLRPPGQLLRPLPPRARRRSPPRGTRSRGMQRRRRRPSRTRWAATARLCARSLVSIPHRHPFSEPPSATRALEVRARRSHGHRQPLRCLSAAIGNAPATGPEMGCPSQGPFNALELVWPAATARGPSPRGTSGSMASAVLQLGWACVPGFVPATGPRSSEDRASVS